MQNIFGNLVTKSDSDYSWGIILSSVTINTWDLGLYFNNNKLTNTYTFLDIFIEKLCSEYDRQDYSVVYRQSDESQTSLYAFA